MQSFDHDALPPPRGAILDADPQEHLDALCRTASDLFGTPIALIPLIDEDRFWFRARCGVEEDGADRESAFCNHTIRRARGQALVVQDLTQDSRFAHTPLVVGAPQARFYAGVAIGSISGRTIGTFCVIDLEPRPDFSAAQVRALQELALLAEAHLQLHERRAAAEAEAQARVEAEARLVEREAALRVTQAAHAMAERTACFGYWRIDVRRRTIAWSAGIARIFGRNEALHLLALDEHIGFYHADDRAGVRQAVDEALAGRGTGETGGYDHRSRVIRPDGEERIVTVHGIAQHDDAGRLTALYGVCLDVTDLARSERQQREAGELLRTTLEAMGQGLMMIDPDGRIRVHNQRARTLLDLPDAVLHEGARYADLLRFQAESGEFRTAPPEVRDWLTGDTPRPPISRYERTRPNGVVVEVNIAPTKSGGTVCTYTDVTERRKGEAALRAAEADYQSLFHNAVIGVYRAGLDGVIVQANRALVRLHGYGEGSGLLVPGTDFGHDWYVDPERHAAFLDRLHRDGRVEDFVSEVRRHAGGETIWVSETAWLIPGVDGAPAGYEGTVADATERKRAEALVEHMARHDTLTGLPNRRLFQEVLGRTIADARRRGGRVAVLCCDLDRFKAVNDTFGHPAGDALLRVVADRLGAALREGDTVARLGGDEFAIILADPDEARRIASVARRIIASLARPIDLDGLSAAIGVSIGIAIGPDDGDGPETLFKNADIALYRAKDSGRNTFRFYERGMDAAVATRNLMELDLREAMRTGGFALHYQPIFALADGTPRGFEALLRWNHPVRGPVSPAEFIPVAEESGLIAPMGTWALNEACREAASWPGEMRVAVNVSAVQFRKQGLEQAVIRALAASGLPARRLELEITESVLMQDSDAVIGCLHRLRALGVRIALDDFGTGYSSLSYLCRFPFDKIKVDRSFVRDLDNPVAAAIVRAIVGIGERLGSTITAEGVETEEQLGRLRHKGCTEVQGFLLSRPMATEDARAFMRGRSVAAA